MARLEGIIPALEETAHALAWVLAHPDGHTLKGARRQDDDGVDLVCLSGRGDKDLAKVLAGA